MLKLQRNRNPVPRALSSDFRRVHEKFLVDSFYPHHLRSVQRSTTCLEQRHFRPTRVLLNEMNSSTALRLKGGSPQLTAIVGAVFLAMVYRCISLARKGPGRQDNTPADAGIKNIQKKKNALGDQIVQIDSAPSKLKSSKRTLAQSPYSSTLSTLEKSQSFRPDPASAPMCSSGPMKMVLVVRTDLQMSAGKVTPASIASEAG